MPVTDRFLGRHGAAFLEELKTLPTKYRIAAATAMETACGDMVSQCLLELSAQCNVGANKLTQREKEIALLLHSGRRGPAIAKYLGVSPKTVGVHMNRLYRKLGVHTSAEVGAVVERWRLGIQAAVLPPLEELTAA